MPRLSNPSGKERGSEPAGDAGRREGAGTEGPALVKQRLGVLAGLVVIVVLVLVAMRMLGGGQSPPAVSVSANAPTALPPRAGAPTGIPGRAGAPAASPARGTAAGRNDPIVFSSNGRPPGVNHLPGPFGYSPEEAGEK